VNFSRFQSAAHIFRLNCAQIYQNRCCRAFREHQLRFLVVLYRGELVAASSGRGQTASSRRLLLMMSCGGAVTEGSVPVQGW